MSSTGLVIGAYPVYGASAEFAAACVAALAPRPDVSGLELPYGPAGIVIPDGCPEGWRHVVTCIGDTMVRMGADPLVGLASPDAVGRRTAVAVIAGLRDLVEAAGTIAAIEIHSGPREISSGAALAESLEEIVSWDWGTTRLLLEHCDRWRDDLPVQKGFLSVADELAALAMVGGKVDLCINWARSVIESRDVATAAEHVAAAAAAGRLGGIMFSSVADADSAYGAAWADAHLPPAGTGAAGDASLLTEELVRQTLAAAGESLAGAIVGLKIGVQPADRPTEERIGHLLETVDLISRSLPR